MLSTEFKLRTIVELGTRGGLSTTAFLLAAKKIGGHVFSFDIDPCIDAKKEIAMLGLEEYWTFTQADDLKAPWNRPIDHLFIDTSHTFTHTLAELQKFERYVKPGGIITMHDFIGFPEVDDALRKYAENRTDFRIYRYFNNNGLAVIFKGSRSVGPTVNVPSL
jgi:predicted O-methyltransferase YrrM